ncbi:MAG: beta-ketoacyl-[acyl-carrier-protein] synthase family protein [Elusimicrobiota bacterium]|jgi:3-oxoacyl-[acyl-carrier-protein] synthase II|nr:beta-ketoacyl-[acyl-carrier-protein] synthase family protein [Elusimicrobiota bacterium]
MQAKLNGKRVVITGMGTVSPFGSGADVLTESILDGKSGVSVDNELKDRKDIASFVSSRVPQIDFTSIPRQYLRTMSDMSKFAYFAAKEALETAGFETATDDTALFLGSTTSSYAAWVDGVGKYKNENMGTIPSENVFQTMNHSLLLNISQSLGLKIDCFGLNTACSTGIINAGLAYLAISNGLMQKVLCGGADEWHPLLTGQFFTLNAAVTKFNDEPQKASRPFDKNRGGIVCGEGAGILFIESLESALKRNAKIYGEIIGFANSTETRSISVSSRESIKRCMSAALENAKILPDKVDFISAHATSTVIGDIEESEAIKQIFGDKVLVSSFKGHLGHTMAASGIIELVAALKMMEKENFAGTLNLENVDEKCGGVNHFSGVKKLEVNIFIKNSFGLGGSNSSLIIRRYK